MVCISAGIAAMQMLPLKETLAATIADLGRIRQISQMYDPFCGSGTLVIEAAQKALNMAPGLRRRFAAEKYGFVPAESWQKARSEALAAIRRENVEFQGFGSDMILLQLLWQKRMLAWQALQSIVTLRWQTYAILHHQKMQSC